ncbi:MAG: murein biosynthesis integral membrane protein MurJ [Verrucomicrobiota bacterium]
MKNGKVIRSAGIVGSFTLLSRGLGMVRDVVFAYFFGTSLMASAFLVAFKIPNLFRRLFGEGALSAAFVPVLIEVRTKQSDKEAWEMASKVVTMAFIVLSAIAIVGVLLFSVALHLPGLSEKWMANFSLSRIMFPYVLFICMAALCMAILNSYRHFSTSAFAPCLLNLILIASMLVFPLVGNDPANRAHLLAGAVLLAGVAQIAIQIPALKRFGCPFRFSSHWDDPHIRQILLLMGPAALGAGITQINVLIDGYLAVWVGDWAPAALFYSERLVYFPLGIIATAMATVLLPTFSVHAAEDDQDSFGETLTHSLKYLIFIMVPASLGLLVLSSPIIQTVFEWGGSFNTESTLLSARALCFYAPGLVVFSAAKIFVPAFYAMQDTKTPVRIGLLAVLLNLTMNIAFILTLPTYWKHAGMALSTVLAGAVNVTILGIILARRVKNIQWLEILRTFIRSLFTALVMAIAAWAATQFLSPILEGLLPSKVAQLAVVALSISLGALVYLSLAGMLRSPELHEIKTAIRRR